MWFCYEESRGWADRAGFPLQVQAPRNVDRFLFFGTDPNVWMQRHFYNANVIRWYDKVASATYFTHFIFPVIALAVVASGFLLRGVAGGAAAGIPLSQRFLLVAAFGALFMVAGKRYGELVAVGDHEADRT